MYRIITEYLPLYGKVAGPRRMAIWLVCCLGLALPGRLFGHYHLAPHASTTLLNLTKPDSSAHMLALADPAGGDVLTMQTPQQLIDWLEGQVMGEGALMVYFEVSDAVFDDFIEDNAVSSFDIQLIWINHAGSLIRQVASDTLGLGAADFSIEEWVEVIQPADTLGGSYFATIHLDGVLCSDLVPIPIVQDTIVTPDPDLPIELPEFDCGDPYTPENITNTTPLTTAQVGDIFTIAGFPILIQTLDFTPPNTNGMYGGTGILPLPFTKKIAMVQFTNITVNTDYKVIAGEVTAMVDNVGNYPDFTMNVVSLGGDICIPPPDEPGYNSDGINEVTGLDAWGFDTNGIHSQTMDSLDMNGFRQDGTYKDTGSPYNDQGCNRVGYTEDGEKCDPSAGANPESEAYAEDIRPGLPTRINDALAEITSVLQDSLLGLNCGALRTQMTTLVGQLSYDTKYIFGENDEYLNTDMHLNFTAPPAPMVLRTERDTLAEELEEKHVELYYCDKLTYAFNKFLDEINNLDAAQIDALSDQIAEEVAKWSESMLNANSDSTSFEAWLLRELGTIIRELSGLDESYGAVQPEETLQRSIPSLQEIFDLSGPSSYGALASTETIFDAAGQPELLEALQFHLAQGDEYILGQHRALFLEELAKHQMMMEGPNDGLVPIRVDRTVANRTVSIYLEDIRISPTGALLTAHVVIEDPSTGGKFVLSGYDIGFNPTGLIGPSELVLGSDIEIRLSNSAKFIVKAQDTRARWNCEGFESLSLGAEIEFCPEFILPVGPDLKPLPDERYRLQINLDEISSWLEFDLEVNADPFVVTKHEDIVWHIDRMVVDMSSSITPKFPPLAGYDSPFLVGSTLSPQWKGFYMKKFQATFSNDIGGQSSNLTIGVNDVIIDGTGFTGQIFAGETVMSIDTGSIADWAFSIDALQVTILHNQLSGAGFKGLLKVPLFDEAMVYSATVFPGNEYRFAVEPLDSLTADVFQSKVVLCRNSRVDIGLVNGEFLAKAHLNGSIYFTPGADRNMELKGLCFEGFEISNKAPYFSPGRWGIDGSIDLAFDLEAFRFMLTDIHPYDPGTDKIGLGFGAELVLVDALDIAASGQFGLEGKLEFDAVGRQRWVYDRFAIEGLGLSTTIAGLGTITGSLRWYGDDAMVDPMYGKGFQGSASIELEGGLSVHAVAQFGEVNDKKYFFVDGLVGLGAIGSATGPIQIRGFGGGVSYRMDISGGLTSFAGVPDSVPTLPPLGASLSGTNYTPDVTKGLSVKATALMAIGAEDVFNGTVSFFIEFNQNFGISEVGYVGAGKFLTGIVEDLPLITDIPTGDVEPDLDVEAVLTAYVDITLNFETKSLDGTLLSYLNAGPLQGAGTNGKLVDAQMHFGPDSWYIYIGTPEEGKRAGIRLSIPPVVGIEATAYLDIGNNIPNFPGVPENVRSIASGVRVNEDLRQSGSGFAFGAALNFALSAKLGGIAKASLEAGAGFDVMLKRYKGLLCDGQPVGLDGWYASGQMWAYIDGYLEAFGARIIEAGFAAVLQGRLPNPFWAQALIGLKVKLGFIKVKKTLKLEIGDDCLLTSSNPDEALGLDVIAYLAPVSGTEGVETDVRPQAHLAMALDRDYRVADLNGNDQVFRAELYSTSLSTSAGVLLPHHTEITDEDRQIQLIPDILLPGNDTIIASVTLKIYRNGTWLADETKETTFLTGDPLHYIPQTNVASSYPPNLMYNFYADEYNAREGFIQLISGQPDLLYDIPTDYVQKVRLTGDDGQIRLIDYTYDPLENRLSFPLTSNDVTAGTIYHLELVRAPATQLRALQSGAAPDLDMSDQVLAALNSSNEFVEPNSGQNQDRGDEVLADGILYQSYFRASQFATVQAKFDQIMASGTGDLRNISPGTEFFDRMEVQGNETEPLLVVDISATDNTTWFNEVRSKFAELKQRASDHNCGNQVPAFDPAEVEGGVVLNGSANFVSLHPLHFDEGFAQQPAQNLLYELEKSVQSYFQSYKQAVLMCSSSGGFNGQQTGASDQDLKIIQNMILPSFTGNKEGIYRYRLPDGTVTTSRTIQF